MSGQRVRLVSLQIALQVVADDGENLVPMEVPPVVIPASAWAQFDLAEVLEHLQAQVDGAPQGQLGSAALTDQ